MRSITQYYSSEEVIREIFSSVDHPSRRFWKVQDTDGKFRQNDKKINCPRRLKEFLLNIEKVKDEQGNFVDVIKSEPAKVYVSVAQFLHPETVFGKIATRAQWVIDDSLFLASDLIFDVDDEKLSLAREDAKTILRFMETQKGYALREIRYTANKGFHLNYEDLSPVQEENPIKRLLKTEEKRKRLVEKMPDLQTINDVHKMVIADQFRVQAAIGSIKANTGHKVEKIDLPHFLSSKEVTLHRVVRPVKRPMITDDSIRTSIPGKGRPTLSSSPFSFKFVDNMVKGTRKPEGGSGQCIAVLKYPRGKKVNIRAIQKRYNLSHFFKFQYSRIDMYVNFKLLDRARLDKIMKYARPMNLGSHTYFGHTWIPITACTDAKGNEVWPAPELVEIFESDLGVEHPHSKPHSKLLNMTFSNMGGADTNRICIATMSGVEQ